MILVGRNGKETVRKLDVSCSKHYKFYPSGRVERDDKEYDNRNIQINWGYVDSTNNRLIVYNDTRRIRNGFNKRKSRMHLQSNGIPVPKTFTIDSVTRDDMVNFNGKFICRKDQHYAGRDLVVAESYSDLFKAVSNGYTYFSKFYNKSKEYRVHVAHGKVLSVQQKIPRDISVTNNIIWNHASGAFVFEVVQWNECSIDILRPAVEAVKALGMDFGAVDILAYPADADDPVAVVCEVNTSPSLADYMSDKYSKYFNWLHRSNERRNWWPYEQYTKPKSFFWQNCHFES